jgi:Holliday junction resolvase RusA-like endonuclease
MILKIFLPNLPPGINQTYLIGNKHLYKSEKARDWENQASLIIGSEAAVQDWVDDSDFYEVDIKLQNSNHDVDAYTKLVIDCLTQKLGFNDNRILKQCSEKIKADEKGVWIELKPVSEN